MKITAEMLRAEGACPDQVAVFEKHWPNGADPRRLPTLKKAARLGLDLDWFAGRFLSEEAWAAYREARATAWAAYEEATATALAAYDEATATALHAVIKQYGLET
jgi:hypothetical protein